MEIEKLDPRARLKICRDEVMHEYNVLANRLTSFITSQSFLVSAYAVSMNNVNPSWGDSYRLVFPLLLSAVGIVLSVRANPGITGVCDVINKWHERQEAIFLESPHLEEYAVLQRPTTRDYHQRSLLFAEASAWIFIVTWLALGRLSVWLSFGRH
jgi:hypothetical protein